MNPKFSFTFDEQNNQYNFSVTDRHGSQIWNIPANVHPSELAVHIDDLMQMVSSRAALSAENEPRGQKRKQPEPASPEWQPDTRTEAGRRRFAPPPVSYSQMQEHNAQAFLRLQAQQEPTTVSGYLGGAFKAAANAFSGLFSSSSSSSRAQQTPVLEIETQFPEQRSPSPDVNPKAQEKLDWHNNVISLLRSDSGRLNAQQRSDLYDAVERHQTKYGETKESMSLSQYLIDELRRSEEEANERIDGMQEAILRSLEDTISKFDDSKLNNEIASLSSVSTPSYKQASQTSGTLRSQVQKEKEPELSPESKKGKEADPRGFSPQ